MFDESLLRDRQGWRKPWQVSSSVWQLDSSLDVSLCSQQPAAVVAGTKFAHTPLLFSPTPLKTTPAGVRPNKQGLAQTARGRIAMKLRGVGVNFCWQQLDMGRMMMMIVEHTWRRRKVKKERCRRERYERRLTQRSLSSSNAT